MSKGFICPICGSTNIKRQESNTKFLLECLDCGMMTKPIKKEK